MSKEKAKPEDRSVDPAATWAFMDDPLEAAHAMIDHVDRKRAALNLPPLTYKVPCPPRVPSETAAAAGS